MNVNGWRNLLFGPKFCNEVSLAHQGDLNVVPKLSVTLLLVSLLGQGGLERGKLGDASVQSITECSSHFGADGIVACLAIVFVKKLLR